MHVARRPEEQTGRRGTLSLRPARQEYPAHWLGDRAGRGLRVSFVSESSFTGSNWLRTRAGPLVGIALLLGAVGYGCYVGGTYLLARHYSRQGEQALAENRFDTARRHFAHSLDLWKRDPDVHFLAARAARRQREFKDAEAHLRTCKELGVDADQLQLEWAMMQAQRDTPAISEGYLLALVEKGHADSGLICEALIQGYLKTYQLPKAYQCAARWLDREPDNLAALFWRGMIWEKIGNNRLAAADFEQVVAGQPDNRAARLHLGTMLLSFKEFDRAVEQFEWLCKGDPKDLQIRLGVADCFIAQNRLEEAQSLLDEVLRDFPDNPIALSERGKVAFQLNNSQLAEQLLRRALAFDPYDPETAYAMSQVLQQLGLPDEAKLYREKHETILTDLKRLADLGTKAIHSPRDANLRCEIGVIFMRNGREQEGLGWLNTALQMDRRHRPANKALAEYFERHGMTREAAYHWEQAGGAPAQGGKEKRRQTDKEAKARPTRENQAKRAGPRGRRPRGPRGAASVWLRVSGFPHLPVRQALGGGCRPPCRGRRSHLVPAARQEGGSARSGLPRSPRHIRHAASQRPAGGTVRRL